MSTVIQLVINRAKSKSLLQRFLVCSDFINISVLEYGLVIAILPLAAFLLGKIVL